MTAPRVLHVSQAVGYGLTRYLSDLVSDQARRGWPVVLATPPDDVLAARCAALGVEHIPWSARRSPGPSVAPELVALRRIIERVDPDVVHLHCSKAGLVGRLALRGRRPTIFTPHAWSFHAGGWLTRGLALRWERIGARWASVVVCVSDAERDRGVRAGIRARYEVVPNAVDLDRFPPAHPGERERARDRLGLDSSPIAVCVGRLAPQKGQDVLLDVWPGVTAAVPGAWLVLVGDGPDAEVLRGREVPAVRFVGRRDDVRDWIVAADLVVQPSRWEGQSLTTLEAMATGRSVVASAVDGMRELLGLDGDAAGALVAVGDRRALGDAIVERLTDPARTAAEGLRARTLAEDHGLGPWGDRLAAVTTQVEADR